MTIEPDLAAAIEAAENLATVIEDENRALSVSDFRTSVELTEAKRAAIVCMEELVGRIPNSRSGELNRLIAAQRRLDAAVIANRDLLRAAIETQQRVIRSVVHALDMQDDGVHVPTRYGQDQSGRSSEPVALVLRA